MRTNAEILERWAGDGDELRASGHHAPRSEPNRWALWVTIPSDYLGPTIYRVRRDGTLGRRAKADLRESDVIVYDTVGMT